MSESALQSMKSRLDEVESSLTRLLNHLPGMAYRCTVREDKNNDYSMVFVSNGSYALLGLTPEGIMRSPANIVEQMMMPEHLGKVRRIIDESIEKRTSYEIFYALRLPNEQEKWIWDQGEGVYDASGKCLFLEGIMMDVTNQKNRELSLKKENRQLRSSIKNAQSLGNIVGSSKGMQDVYSLMLKVAKSDTNVILYGETGVGKDLVAKTIHGLSSVKGPYIPVNCAAIPEQLLESEFFGHVKGAFSGATSSRHGYLAAADNGTLFLDEIGELPLNLQVKLLRALESKTFTPVGSNDVRTSNFRLISATNQNLSAMVARRTLRADFFYRINVLSIHIPPLRERLDDLPLLIQAYAEEKGVTAPLSSRFLWLLNRYSWPGNVRELHNVLEQYWTFGEHRAELYFTNPPSHYGTPPAVVMSSDSLNAEGHPPSAICPELDRADTAFPHPYQQPQATPREKEHIASPYTLLSDARDDEERRRILLMLEKCSWRKGKTAESLGISLRTLQRKIKRYDISG